MLNNPSVVDYSLYRENLQAWRDWLALQEKQVWLLTWAIRANRAAITVSMPLWPLATVISVPLGFVAILTGGLVFWPFHWFLIRPLTFLVLSTSRLWWTIRPLRPALLLEGPLITTVSMVVVSLIPDMNPDHKDARQILYELWPLSQPRLDWIAEHGNVLAPGAES